MEGEMATSATIELGKHPFKKVTTGLLGKTNNETNKLVVGLWKTSQNYEVITDHKWKSLDSLEEQRMENSTSKEYGDLIALRDARSNDT